MTMLALNGLCSFGDGLVGGDIEFERFDGGVGGQGGDGLGCYGSSRGVTGAENDVVVRLFGS